eukprot:8779567-Pyramimonas_sp.AAC.1
MPLVFLFAQFWSTPDVCGSGALCGTALGPVLVVLALLEGHFGSWAILSHLGGRGDLVDHSGNS